MQKIKYQYSYFILPYSIDTKKYDEYLQKLLNIKNIEVKEYTKQKELEVYSFFNNDFLRKLRNTVKLDYNAIENNRKDKFKTMAKKLSFEEVCVFNFNISSQTQGKVGEEKQGIFFRVENANIVTTKEGICFLLLKTTVETEEFSDILNFNYKFREISRDVLKLKKYDNIKIQSDEFNEAYDFQKFIEEITGINIQNLIKNQDTDKLYTFSYLCVDNSMWNERTDFKELQTHFYKYTEVLPAEFNSNFTEKNKSIEVLEDLKYSKIGLSTLSSNLFSSGVEVHNFTKLPYEYEKNNLYIYLYEIYQKIYIDRLTKELEKDDHNTIYNVARKYNTFTKKIYNKEITKEVKGITYSKKLRKILGLEAKYNALLKKFKVIYGINKIEENNILYKKIYKVVILLLAFNIINFALILKYIL